MDERAQLQMVVRQCWPPGQGRLLNKSFADQKLLLHDLLYKIWQPQAAICKMLHGCYGLISRYAYAFGEKRTLGESRPSFLYHW